MGHGARRSPDVSAVRAVMNLAGRAGPVGGPIGMGAKADGGLLRAAPRVQCQYRGPLRGRTNKGLSNLV
jgi:hypothetical protein